jgi:DNA polymerase-1
MIKEYLEGSGDIHSLVASICFKDELEGIPVKDIKKLRPDLRTKAKGPEFASQFGGGAKAIASSIGCSKKEAEEIAEAYKQGFKGITTFKEVGGNLVKQLGYVLMTKKTGHKMYWEDWDKWKRIHSFPDYEAFFMFSAKELDEHRKAEAKWERMALNAPTQGSGAVIIKYACILLFKWILQNNYFNKVLLCNIVHDEIVIEFPKELESIAVPKLVELMETASSKFCEKLPIPAEPSTGDHWIH